MSVMCGLVRRGPLAERAPTGHSVLVFSHRRRALAALAVLGAMVSGCSSTHTSAAPSRTLALPAAGNSTASLRATAIAWAHAFLVGSLADIRALQGPECSTQSDTSLPTQVVADYLTAERGVMRQHVGRPLNQIKITGVAVRNVTSTSGEAVVEYDLPAAVVGNDNWVTYSIHDGRWKVSDCHAPIGGSSSSASTSVATPAP